MQSRRDLLVAVVLLLASVQQAFGVILYSTATRNTDPPGSLTNRGTATGPQGNDDPRRLLNSGWQWEGQFDTGAGFFLGTAIGPHHFITARHVAFGSNFVYQGTTYSASVAATNPDADLRLWQINGTFPNWAPLYSVAVDGSEVGKPLVAIGRGTQRTNEIRVGGALRGWEWGPEDHVQSWGENVVSGITNFAATPPGGTPDQQLLYFDFDAGAGPNEGALSNGDSGGAVFIKSGGVWKLAGINYSADGPSRTSADGQTFSASLFNLDGLFYNFGTDEIPDWQALPNGLVGSSYVTRISQNLAWINQFTGIGPQQSVVPEPSISGIFLATIALLARRRRGG